MTPGGRTLIIAEAGVNHNGSLELALRLVDEARSAGADAVKFQTFRAERLASRSAKKASYQRADPSSGDDQVGMLEALELSADDHRALLARCRSIGITFLSSPFDEESADFLEGLGITAFKIPSGELTNSGFLAHVAAKGTPMILSTGMSTLEEVADAVATVREAGNRELTLLHCVTAYPAAYDEVNLRAMLTMKDAFGLPVGYSDHTPGVEVAVAAVAMGAVVIEKHFTLSRGLPGPDHRASLEPPGLAQLVSSVRNVEQALGDGVKAPSRGELANMAAARKSVVARRDLATGDTLSREDVVIQRPGDGIPPRGLSEVLGRTLTSDVAAGSVIRWEDVS